jgi:hypothetical protein
LFFLIIFIQEVEKRGAADGVKLKWRKEYPGGGTIYKPLQGVIHYPYFNRRRDGPAVHSFEYYLQKIEAAAAKKVSVIPI